MEAFSKDPLPLTLLSSKLREGVFSTRLFMEPLALVVGGDRGLGSREAAPVAAVAPLRFGIAEGGPSDDLIFRVA